VRDSSTGRSSYDRSPVHSASEHRVDNFFFPSSLSQFRLIIE
jgi:hypothetical protein